MRNLKYIFSCLAIVASLVLVTSCEEDFTETVEIGGIDVTEAIQGAPVTLTGTGFEEVRFVFLGDREMTYTVEGSAITFTIPEDQPVGETTITLAMKSNRRVSAPFTVLLAPRPVISGFDAWVGVGNNLVITGTSLDNNTSVTIDGIAASVVSASDTELVVTVPDGVFENGPIDFEITTDYGVTEPTTAFYARENLLANSDLELGDGDAFDDWEKLNEGPGMFAATGADGYGETRSMYVIPAAGNPWDSQLASTGVPLTFGETYTIVMWAKADAAGAFMRVSVSQWDGSGADYFYGDNAEFSTNWEQYTWTFDVTNDLATHRVVLDMGAGSVPFTIDHMALIPGTMGASGPPENLVNGDFEDGMANWETLNGTHEVSTAEFYCGTQSMTATGAGGNPWDTQLASDPMDLEEGTDYEISFWAKAAGPDGVFRVSMSQFASGQSDDFFYSPDLEIPEDWAYFSFVTTAQETSTGVQRLLFDMGATSQTFFVDAVSVKEYVPVASSAYANGDFEDGLTGWETLNGTHEVSTAEFVTGGASMTATGAGGNPWDTQLASDPVALTVGQDYKISFWAKAAGPDGVFRVSMSQFASGQSDDFFYSPDLEITEDWTYFAFVTTAAETSTGDHRLLFDMGATSQTFFVDDVQVQEYDACE